MVICLKQGANDLHMVQLMPVSLRSPLASLKSRMVLPFWCQLTQAVLEKRPLNGCLPLPLTHGAKAVVPRQNKTILKNFRPVGRPS